MSKVNKESLKPSVYSLLSFSSSTQHTIDQTQVVPRLAIGHIAHRNEKASWTNMGVKLQNKTSTGAVLRVKGKRCPVSWSYIVGPGYWRTQAKTKLALKLKEQRNENVAKNVIMFLGDGMSVPTITATRILKGQLEGNTGEETVLSFEKFPYTGLSKVRE